MTWDTEPVPEQFEREFKQDYPYLSMSPDEWVGCHSHKVGCLSIAKWQFQDMVFRQWIVAMGEMLHDRRLVLKLRKQYLTSDEFADALRIESEEF